MARNPVLLVKRCSLQPLPNTRITPKFPLSPSFRTYSSLKPPQTHFLLLSSSTLHRSVISPRDVLQQLWRSYSTASPKSKQDKSLSHGQKYQEVASILSRIERMWKDEQSNSSNSPSNSNATGKKTGIYAHLEELDTKINSGTIWQSASSTSKSQSIKLLKEQAKIRKLIENYNYIDKLQKDYLGLKGRWTLFYLLVLNNYNNYNYNPFLLLLFIYRFLHSMIPNMYPYIYLYN